ncbi:MAG: PilN domain-containing protein, partial [Desulfobulbaceae bacterium]|nr:PilN domain-containing protein [Desulfobulbaceae bacterium]
VSSADLVLVRDNNVVFMRRIVYPDSVLAEQILAMVDNEGLINDRHAALDFITELCRLIERNIYFFQRNHETAVVFDKAVLTGIMTMDNFFSSTMEQQLGVKVRKMEMFAVSGLAASDIASRAYRSWLHDRALALALQGFQKSSTMNFYQDNASAVLRFIRNKKQMGITLGVLGTAFLTFMGFLGLTHTRLQDSYDKLDRELEAIYLETFPSGTLKTEPYLQMQSKLKELRDPADGVPLFPTDKRMLNILADISSRIPKNINLEVDRLIIDQDSVRIKGNTETFNDINAMKSKVEESALYENVDILSASADPKENNIRFELKLQLIGEN